VDISADALKVAEGNSCRLLTQEKRPAFIESDLFEKVEGCFDIIVSNPPYIRTAVIDTLMPEVKDHEPMQALDGLEDGLYFYRKIVEEAPAYLNKDGRLYFEIGHDQGAEVSAVMANAGFKQVRVVKDYAGLDRVVSGIY
jgi:release factor glutamine methyltransferase